eukprot:TRINITY_DN64_c10_g1_i1.p1 TRINITY_DN64_c10_g1~~TRINITY_DN64_c10_g1_i1.p1  ORF type:complete len:809 (-),score=232.86 TRINITY_DN64_c10_g1_i1:351-2777(-)
MSTKIDKDEQIETKEVQKVDPSSEEFAGALFSHALSVVSWDDINNFSLVCHGWRQIITGPAVAQPEYARKFKEKYGNKKIGKLLEWRSKSQNKAVEHCMLLLLEGQMLLRELAEYQKPPPLKIYEDIRHQIAKFPTNDSEEQDLLARIQNLRKLLLKSYKENSKLEKDLKEIENKISLLIGHRTSIIELDRKKKKAKKHLEESDKPTFYKDTKKLNHYAELFYLLRTEPKYFAKLAYMIPPSKAQKQAFAETVILTMYSNAFSPLEEFLLIELLQKAVEFEIRQIKQKFEEFTASDSVVPFMILSYNKRKQGREYIKSTFSKPILEILDQNERFVTDPITQAPAKLDTLSKFCDTLFDLIVGSVDSLPYGLRFICKAIYELSRQKFADAPEIDIWRVVGYFTFYRFIGLAIIQPDEFGLCEKEAVASTESQINLAGVSKVLKAVFADLKPMDKGDVDMNDWVIQKKEAVIKYFKAVIDVPNPEEKLRVNKYAQLSKIEKDTLVITLREIVQLHQLVSTNKTDLAPDNNDPLNLILKDIGDIPPAPPVDDETEVQLELQNRFPPELSKLDRKKNLKAQTIDDAIKIMQKIPGFSGDTFLEIFVRMKLQCQKAGEHELAKEVNNVIANLQNLAKHGLVKVDNGFNSFFKDIQIELQDRGQRKIEHAKEIERLERAIKELNEQKEHMNGKINELNAYLGSVRTKANESFVPQTKKFKYKDLVKEKVIADSEIPTQHIPKVRFLIEQKTIDEFLITGKVKNLPMSQEFTLLLENLLACKDNGQATFNTERGLELNVASTIIFLNKQFYSHKK